MWRLFFFRYRKWNQLFCRSTVQTFYFLLVIISALWTTCVQFVWLLLHKWNVVAMDKTHPSLSVYLWEDGAGSLHDRRISSVVKFILKPGQIRQFFQLLKLSVSLVTNQGAIEMHSKDNEDKSKRNHNRGGSNGGSPPGWSSTICRVFALDRQEFNPAEQNHLG